jgi:alkanesulfonate monooxygenase SsuD/methylene tetrahydromethanopterin reductase-like flavin-dependent oxidoreductase (luciferase family)
MLPNHAPLRVAEAFHTLEALHPGRVDLGLGRAPGTDPATSQALRPFDAHQFPAQLSELLSLSRQGFAPGHPFHGVRVVPAGVPLPPVWLLGSSGASAELAGSFGLGYGFASHFSPAPPAPDAEAAYHASSMELARIRLQRGEFGPIPTPEEALAHPYAPHERAIVESYRRLNVVGTGAGVRDRLLAIAADAGADELLVTTTVTDPTARLRSYELLADAFAELGTATAA